MFSAGLYKAESDPKRRLVEAALQRDRAVDLEHRHTEPVPGRQVCRSVDIDDFHGRHVPAEHVFRLLAEMASTAGIQHDPHG